MVHGLKTLLAFALAGSLLIACSGTKVSDSWSSQDFTGKIRNVYIIGIARTELNRMMFENLFSSRLTEAGIKAAQSYPDLPKDHEAEREIIIEKMQANGSDSVLLTRVIDQRTTASFISKRTSVSYESRPNVSGAQGYNRNPLDAYTWNSYYSNGYRTVIQPAKNTNLVVLTVESVLYDLKTEELIWSARMETDLERNLESMMQKFVDQAVKELKEKGFI